jgi:hypothetical protein
MNWAPVAANVKLPIERKSLFSLENDTPHVNDWPWQTYGGYIAKKLPTSIPALCNVLRDWYDNWRQLEVKSVPRVAPLPTFSVPQRYGDAYLIILAEALLKQLGGDDQRMVIEAFPEIVPPYYGTHVVTRYPKWTPDGGYSSSLRATDTMCRALVQTYMTGENNWSHYNVNLINVTAIYRTFSLNKPFPVLAISDFPAPPPLPDPIHIPDPPPDDPAPPKPLPDPSPSPSPAPDPVYIPVDATATRVGSSTTDTGTIPATAYVAQEKQETSIGGPILIGAGLGLLVAVIARKH